MLPGLRSNNGSIYINELPPPAENFAGGIGIHADGAIYITPTLPIQAWVNGFGVRHDGQLCVSYGGAIAYFDMGLPFTADGRLVCQLNQAVSPSDPFVGGVRVGPLGGVYTLDLTPPVAEAFNSGFSLGFS